MVKRDFILFLEDILLSMKRIDSYLDGVVFEEFEREQILLDAVVRNLEIIGEAANKIPQTIRDKYPQVPW